MRYGYLVLAHDQFQNKWNIPLMDVRSLAKVTTIAKVWLYKVLAKKQYPFWVIDQNEHWAAKQRLSSSEVAESREEIRFHICRYNVTDVKVGLTPIRMFLAKSVRGIRSEDTFWYAESFKPKMEKEDSGTITMSFDEQDEDREYLTVEDLEKIATVKGFLPDLQATQHDWVRNAGNI